MSAAASEGHMALAKKLASNAGKTRDKAMHQLRAWLIKRKDMDDLDLLKVWKGLFYCFWMSDKPQVQFELAQRISGLLLPLQDDRTVQFMKAFFVTMNREWGGIDRLRLDKYMKLVRQMVFHAFKTLQQRQFKEEVVTAMADVFIEHALDWKNTAQRGIFLHVADILLGEASKVSAEGPAKMPFAVLERFLDPLFATLAECKDSSLVKRVNSVVFDQLLAAAALPSEDEERSEEDAALHAILKGNIDTIAKKLFKLASDKATSEKLRPNIYALREKFQQIQADHEEKAMAVESDEETAPAPPALAPKKKGKRKHEEEAEQNEDEEEEEKKSAKQSTKQSKQKQQTSQPTPVLSEAPLTTDKKKGKKQQKQQKQAEEVKEEKKQSVAEVENKKEKKQKKNKKQRTEAVVQEKQAEEEDEKQEHHLSKEQAAKAMTHYPAHVPSPKKTHTKMQIKGHVHTDVQSSDGTSLSVNQDVDVEMALTSPHSKKNKKKGSAAVAPLTPSTVAAITSNLFSFAAPSSSDAPTTPRSSSSSTPSHTRVKFSVNGSPHVQMPAQTEQDPSTPSRDKTLPPPVTPGAKKGVWFSLEDNQVKEFERTQRLQNMDVKGMLAKPSPGPKIKPAKLPIRIKTFKSPLSAAAAANAKMAAQTGSAQRRQASSYF